MKNHYLRALSGFVVFVVLSCSFQPGHAQAYPVQTPVQQSLCTYVNGYYEWLPPDYNTNTTKKYPVLIFIHGSGEAGNGTTQLSRVLTNGPPKLIDQQKFPTSFTVNGQVFSFIVISPQFTGQYRDADDFNLMVNNIKAKYRVDTDRIYLTGLSMGGGLSWWYSSAKQEYAAGLAAMAVVCGNFNANGTGVTNLGRANLPIKIFHNDGDPTVPVTYSQNWYNGLTAFTPAMSPKTTLTIFNSTSHDAWSKTYDPNYKENNLNVYEWMLTNSRGTATPPPVNSIPVVGAGNDITISLPTSQVTLTGSATDQDGSIASYAWSKIEGPTSFSITSPNAAQTTVTGLVAGLYKFALAATDNAGAVNKDTVAVTVMASATGSACEANAGPDQTIVRGTASSAVLDGSASIGTNLTYSWKLLTTVSSDWKSNLKNATQSQADVIILPYLDGGYKYELTVSDGAGCTSKDTTTVLVNWGKMPYKSTDQKAWHVATATDMANIPNAKAGDLIIDGANNGNISAGPVEINILSTDQISLKAGQKVLIRGGRYGAIRLNFSPGTVRGTKANPVIITNYDGQVECTYMAISNAVGAKLTGKYVPGISGDVNFPGHDKGNYAFSRGKYGIFCNSAWGSLSSSGLQVWGATTDSLEVEYLEIGNGHFAGMMVKDDGNSNVYTDFYFHDLYIHDIHGEGVYIGSTGGDPQTLLNGLRFENVRIVNAGNEIFQFGQVGYGSVVKNNVFVNSANNRRSTFANYQDNGAQLNYRSGYQQFRNNIMMGTGDAAFNAFVGSKTGVATPNDTVYICNNLVKYGAGALGAYFTSNNALPTTVVKIDSNYFGGFDFTADEIFSDSRGVNTTTLIKIANSLPVIFSNNKSDGTKSVLTTGTSKLSSNTINAINNPNFVNSGWPASFDYAKLTEWGDFIFNTWKDEFANQSGVKFNSPIVFQAGDYVTFLSKTYRSKISNNQGHVPRGKTDDYWELITWAGGGNTYTFPPDDYRLIDGDEYKNRNIGLLTDVNVQPQPNNPPVADAGADRTVTLPIDTVKLSGKGTDTDGTITLYQWTKIAGPAVTIDGANTATATLSGLAAGVYQFELLVGDDKGATDKDTVVITVNAAPNKVPVADAGEDIYITLPVNYTILNGQATDEDGTIVSYLWTKISGPSSYTLANANSAATDLTALVAGEYLFELTAKDDSGAVAKDTVKVTVGTVPVTPNIAPVAKAGTDITITLPTNSTTLSGSGTDSDGSVVGYQWRKVSGPSTYTIATATAAGTGVSGLVQGVYEFELTVKDDKGATGKDTVKVTVQAAPNKAPVANAGTDITITLPTNSTTLSGSGTDSDGSIAGYQWKKVSGPAGYSITNAAAASTAVSGLTEGVYEFELTVTDNKGATAKDTVKVTVKPKPNEAPVANAGRDSTVSYPINSVQLDGSASYDPDGQIVSYNWVKVSGPSPFTMTDVNKVNPTILSPLAGTYVIELTVTDDKGATATDRVTIVVKDNSASNVPPHADAGDDQVITLPVDTARLDGSASFDSDGYIQSYQWKQRSGPSTAVIENPTAAATRISKLVKGEYVFEITVKDNLGATTTATVRITVVTPGSHSNDDLKLYPVPAHSDLNFKFEGSIDNKAVIVTVYDMTGAIVLTKKVAGAQYSVQGTIDVRLFRNGIYVLSLKTEDGSLWVTKKFEVIH